LLIRYGESTFNPYPPKKPTEVYIAEPYDFQQDYQNPFEMPKPVVPLPTFEIKNTTHEFYVPAYTFVSQPLP
jgi:hypothetical protein